MFVQSPRPKPNTRNTRCVITHHGHSRAADQLAASEHRLTSIAFLLISMNSISLEGPIAITWRHSIEVVAWLNLARWLGSLRTALGGAWSASRLPEPEGQNSQRDCSEIRRLMQQSL